VVDCELDMFLNSGFSLSMHHEESGELSGCDLLTSWSRDPEYEMLDDSSMTSWHNVAAEIAMEENPKHPQVRACLHAKVVAPAWHTKRRKLAHFCIQP
jgi:hypothetical protein